MEGSTAAAAAAHKRVKRAMGLLRAAAPLLAATAADLDVVGEVHLEPGAGDAELLELLELARHRHRGALDVVILAAPRPAPPDGT